MSRLKWHGPPLPGARFLHLNRRRHSKATSGLISTPADHWRAGQLLPNLIMTEQSTTRETERREKVRGTEGEGTGDDVGGREEDGWLFQAEILRAECKFLRAQRELAAMDLGRNRVRLERTLSSALQTLVSGRKKICEGKALDEEIEHLSKTLRELQGMCPAIGGLDSEIRKCKNLDEQTLILQKRLQIERSYIASKEAGETRERANGSLSNVGASSCSVDGKSDGDCIDGKVEILRSKMEAQSKGMLVRMEEFDSLLFSPTITKPENFDSPWSSSSSSSSSPSSSQKHHSREKSTCSGHCRSVVKRVAEHVRAETEEWVQMQDMLSHVRQEMEDLHASRDFWEDKAHRSNIKSHNLRSQVKEWKRKALASGTKAIDLQRELERLRAAEKEEADGGAAGKCVSADGGVEGEEIEAFVEGSRKAVMGSRRLGTPKRPPLQDIGGNALAVVKLSGKS